MKQRTGIVVIVILFIVISLFARGYYRHINGLWTDELHQLRAVNKPFKNILKFNNYGDHTSFPGDYLLTYLPVKFDNKNYGDAEVGKFNKWKINISHIILQVLALYFLLRICQESFSTWVGWLITLTLYACNQELIFHATEFRPYAAMPFFALGSFWICTKIHSYSYRLHSYNNWQKVLSAIFLIFAFNFHAYGIFFFVLPVLWLWITNKQGCSWRFFLTVFLIAFPIWCWFAHFNTFGWKPNQSQSIVETFKYIPNPVQFPVQFIIIIWSILIGNKIIGFFIAGTFLPLVLFGDKHRTAFLLIFIVLPITLILLVDIKTQYWFIQRQWSWVIPFFHIYMGSIWDKFAERINKND